MAEIPEVKHTLTRSEALDRLSASSELFDSLIRQGKLRVWTYVGDYDQYYPIKIEGALELIESVDKTKKVFCELDLPGRMAKIDAINRRNNEISSPELTYELMRYAPYEIEALIPRGVKFTTRFKKVWLGEEVISPEETQSQVLQYLWEEFLRGRPDVEEKDAYKYVDGVQTTKRLSNTFKKSSPVANLIIRSGTKHYRLNIEGFASPSRYSPDTE